MATPATCDHCGKEIAGSTFYNDEIAWCHECIRDNAPKLKELKLDSFDTHDIEDRIKNNNHQKFSIQSNIEKLRSVPKKPIKIRLKDVKLDQQVKVVGFPDGATVVGIDAPYGLITLGWKEKGVGHTSSTKHAELKNRYPHMQWSASFDEYGSHDWVSMDRDAEIVQDKKTETMPLTLQDAKPGQTIKFLTGAYTGYIGTVLAIEGKEVHIGFKKGVGIDIGVGGSIGKLKEKNLVVDPAASQCDAYLTYSTTYYGRDHIEVIPPIPPAKQEVKKGIKDAQLGDTVRFLPGGDVSYVGSVGTVIAINKYGDRAVAIKNNSPNTAMFASLTWEKSGYYKSPDVKQLPLEEINNFTKYLWFSAPSHVLEITPKPVVSAFLRDVPLGTEVEIKGVRGTVIGKNSTNLTITIGWKTGETHRGDAYASTTALEGLGTTATKIASIQEYPLGFNYGGGELCIIHPSPSRKQLKDVPLGAKVRHSLHGEATVVGKYAGLSPATALGWKEGETAPHLAVGDLEGSNKHTYLPNIKDYPKHCWLFDDTMVEVLEREESMAVNVKDLMPGQEIEHPTHGKMIVLGAYSGSGERLLGKKETFSGATQSNPKTGNTSYSFYDKWDGTGYWTKWFNASEQVNIVGERILKYGLKVGDRVEVFHKRNYTGLMDSGYEPDLEKKTVVGTVVGWNTNGEANVYIEDAGDLKNKINGFNSTIVDKTFLENKSFMDKFNKNPNNFWLIRSDKAFNKITNKERNMDKQERPAFLEMMKADAGNAAYRVAANQMVKGIKSGILAVLEKQGTDGTKMKAISEMLDTEFGSSLVSLLLGVGLQYIPKISEDPRAQKLAGEFRVNGIAVAGNMVVDVAIEHFLPVITGALNALPQETAVRVAEVPQIETKKNDNKLALEEAAREEAEKAAEKTEQTMKA